MTEPHTFTIGHADKAERAAAEYEAMVRAHKADELLVARFVQDRWLQIPRPVADAIIRIVRRAQEGDRR